MPELLAATAPVFTVDGAREGALGRDVLEVVVEHDTAGLATLEATFLAAAEGGDTPGRLRLLDDHVVDFGSRVEVSLGPPGLERLLFAGLVSAVEARFDAARPPRAVLFAEDELMALRLAVRRRTYLDQTDGDIARTLASEHGLRASIEADGPPHPVVQQWGQSDLGFLRSLAGRLGAELWVEDGTLHLATRDRRDGTTLTLVNGLDLLAIDVRADLAHQRSEVQVSGYDPDDHDGFVEKAGPDTIGAEVTGGRTGPAVADGVFGARSIQHAVLGPLTPVQARAWARAEQLRRSRRFVTAEALTNGSPDLVVGSRVELVGVGAPFDGAGYYATRVRHTYDLRTGHRTEVSLERSTVEEG